MRALTFLLQMFAAGRRATPVTVTIPDIDTSAMTPEQIVDHMGNAIGKGMRPGLRTSEIERAVDHFLTIHGVAGYFRGYNGYPSSVKDSVLLAKMIRLTKDKPVILSHPEVEYR